MTETISGFLIIVLATTTLIGWFKDMSVKNKWLDKPTNRGSHHLAVPHIGGVIMMAMLLLSIIALVILAKISWGEAFIWIFIILILGIVGFIDDLKDLSKQLRLIVQIIVAVFVVWQFGGINALNVVIVKFDFGVLSYILGFIWVVGFINMYNFMDGINGLAGCQALIAGLIFAAWLYHFNQIGISLLFLSTVAIAIGFLYWNFSPAKVFMGDSGSTMLGGLFAAVSLKLHNEFDVSIIFPTLIFAWFLTDTSITFIKRLIRKEKVWQAHRQHFYQKLAANPEDHTKVTGMISLLTFIISLISTLVLFKLDVV